MPSNPAPAPTAHVCEIPLTKGRVAIIDAADAELVLAHVWHARRHCRTWYAQTHILHPDGTRGMLQMHRLIMGNPAGLVDHRDSNGLNNTRANLRACSDLENARNARLRSDNRSGFKGASWHRTRQTWEARIRINGRRTHLGYYATAEEAARAYDAAARLHFGEFARLNFPTHEAAA